MDMQKAGYGARLRQIRAAKGFATARDFALAIGVSENKYGRYERGEALPKLHMQHLICSKLGITHSYLLGSDDETGRRTGLPVQDTSASTVEQLGLAEEATEPLTPPPAPRGSREKAAWSLAEQLVERRLATAAGVEKGGQKLIETARLSVELADDPLDTIAAALQSIDFEKLPPGEEDRLSREIAAALDILGSQR